MMRDFVELRYTTKKYPAGVGYSFDTDSRYALSPS
jgi:hypothetical protein